MFAAVFEFIAYEADAVKVCSHGKAGIVHLRLA